MTPSPGWILLVAGLLIAAIEAVWLLAPSIPWLGNLPGDIRIERERLRFYFPMTTTLLVTCFIVADARHVI